MFRKTLIRLTIQNAFVLLLVVSLLGTWLYLFMEDQFFGKTDELLRLRLEAKKAELVHDQSFFILKLPPDFLSEVIVWNEQKELILSPRIRLTDLELMQLFPQKTNGEIETVEFNQVHFRSVASSVQLSSGQAIVQVIRPIDPELNLLNELRTNIIMGCCLAIGIAIATGYWLARRALIPIQQSWQAQQQFVADASHELRTPLAVIQSRTELLLRHPNQTIEEKSSDLSTIYRETRRLSKLVTHLLTLARSDSNQLEIHLHPFSLDELVHEVIDHFKDLAEMKQLHWQATVDTNIQMFGDRERIHQLLVILLDNAFKYTPAGGAVTLTCKKSGNHITIAVSDTGIGISETDLPRIFDRFYRADRSRTREDGGTGLGLSIAKWIVEKHAGKISVQSRLGEGTTFVVKF